MVKVYNFLGGKMDIKDISDEMEIKDLLGTLEKIEVSDQLLNEEVDDTLLNSYIERCENLVKEDRCNEILNVFLEIADLECNVTTKTLIMYTGTKFIEKYVLG
jgi:hypothetical protein